MAKKARPSKSAHKKTPNHRRSIAFVVSILLIGFLLWSVLTTVQDSVAHGRRGNSFCNKGGRGVWFSFCRSGGSSNSCGDGCTCAPFSERMKWGVCRGDGTNTPKPTKGPKPTGGPNPTNQPGDPTPTIGTGGPLPTAAPGTGACGIACISDSECSTGYCHPVGFEVCPTSAPGEPIEDCEFIPPDPTQGSVCAPDTCRNGGNCSCPAQPNNFIYRPKAQ